MRSKIARILFWAVLALSVVSVGLSIAATADYFSDDDGWILGSLVVFGYWMATGVLVGVVAVWGAVNVSRHGRIWPSR